jgi:hypothetical protein
MADLSIGVAIYGAGDPKTLDACVRALLSGTERPGRIAIVADEAKAHWVRAVAAAVETDFGIGIGIDIARPAARSDEISTAIWRASYAHDLGLAVPGHVAAGPDLVASCRRRFSEDPSLQGEMIRFTKVRMFEPDSPDRITAATRGSPWLTWRWLDLPKSLSTCAFAHRQGPDLLAAMAETPSGLPAYFRMREALALLERHGRTRMLDDETSATLEISAERRTGHKDGYDLAWSLLSFEWFQSLDKSVARHELSALKTFMTCQRVLNLRRRTYAGSFRQGMADAEAKFRALRSDVHRDILELN